jgi:hypothetical protein
MRGLQRLKVRGKVAPRFIGPFKITEEKEENWRKNFWISFPIRLNLEGEIHFKGGRFVTPQNFKFWNVIKIR